MNKYYRLSLATVFLIGLTAYSAPTHNTRDNRAIAAENIEESKSLLVWRVGDIGSEDLPDTDVPADLRRRAKKLNYDIDIEAISAKSVTAKLRAAMKQNREPDIITYHDRGVLEGTETDSEKLAGIHSIEGVKESFVFVNNTLNSIQKKVGWIALLNTSQNHDIAKQLALPEPECKKTAETQLIGNVDRDGIENFVQNYTPALFSNSKTEFEKYLSESAIVGLGSGYSQKQKDIKICSVVANNNLAVVSTVVAHDDRGSVGHLDVLLVLHQENDERPRAAVRRKGTREFDNWRLLTQQIGYIIEDARPYINKLGNAIAESEQNTSDLLPASNLTPENIRPKPAEGERFGEFTWQPSQSDDVVAEIIEFSHGVDARLFVKFRDDRIAVEDSISAGGLYHTDSDKWRWRVWSIAADGSIAFSKTQTFQDD